MVIGEVRFGNFFCWEESPSRSCAEVEIWAQRNVFLDCLLLLLFCLIEPGACTQPIFDCLQLLFANGTQWVCEGVEDRSSLLQDLPGHQRSRLLHHSCFQLWLSRQCRLYAGWLYGSSRLTAVGLWVPVCLLETLSIFRCVPRCILGVL